MEVCRGKREPRSYYEIWQTLGVDSPSQILFLTDVYQEATAARDAGLQSHLLSPFFTHNFFAVTSMLHVLN
jgi:methionine salvage enolase-phosphatase E1